MVQTKGICMIASELTFLREDGRKGKEEKNNNLFRWREIEGKKKKKKGEGMNFHDLPFIFSFQFRWKSQDGFVWAHIFALFSTL